MRPGDVVGERFEIVRLAGSGGMGSVWRAKDRAGSSDVALKIVHTPNAMDAERLRREASKLGIISIDREGDRLAVKLTEKAKINPDKLIALVSSGSATFAPSGVLKMGVSAEDDVSVFDEVRGLLNNLR